MKNFRSVIRQLSHEKLLTSQDMYQYGIFRAMGIVSEITYDNRVQAAYAMVRAAFTPISNYNKLTYNCKNGNPYRSLNVASNPKTSYNRNPDTGNIEWLETEMWKCLETGEEKALFRKMSDDVLALFHQKVEDKKKEDYIFVFVRTDLNKTQQGVQSIHVGIDVGYYLGTQGIKTCDINVVWCGAKSENELNQISDLIISKGYQTVGFFETDLNDRLTAIASCPLPYTEKDFLRKYPIIRH